MVDENLLNALTPEQIEMLTVLTEQQEILAILSIAMLQGNIDMFTFTLAGIESGKKATKDYFRTCLRFLQRPEIAKLLE